MKTDFYKLHDFSTESLAKIAQQIESQWVFLQIESGNIEFLPTAEKRFIEIASSTNANMVYADYYIQKDNCTQTISTNEYQKGSIRDDFVFGSIILCNSQIIKEIVANTQKNYKYAALYYLRLMLSEQGAIIHIPEPLYITSIDTNTSNHDKHFAYVNRKNRDAQIEMEEVCTEYLKRIGALLTNPPQEIDVREGDFECEASVIIPVRNRQKTIADAINSVLKQNCSFKYNILIVDNHSTDNTGKIVEDIAATNEKVIRLVPQSRHLGIGGCWSLAVRHNQCGRFAIQLDSDDIYQSETTLQTIVDEFYKQKCAMMIGSYTTTNFNLTPIEPYLVDHAEWTDNNGRNNALRINGLGAPRAFYTPIIRQIDFPNVSYGEDYAVGLRISRQWKIGRIYDSIYLCRRWENNSDSNISTEKINQYNHYKDKIRTIELLSRQNHNKFL